MINPKDITFVLQGKNVEGKTLKSMKLIRKNFPNSKIIFSTYIGENTSDLDFDFLVESEDPGAIQINNSCYNQINRVLVTSKAGLKKVNTKYCVRMRSDLYIKHNGLLNIYHKFNKYDSKYKVLKERVVFFQLWTRLNYKLFDYMYTPFYFSDWFCFGLTEDICKIYLDCPLTVEPEFTYYFKDTIFPRRFDTEQYIGNHFCKKYFQGIEMSDSRDYSKEKMEISNKILANNFIIANYNQIGIYLDKQPYKNICKKDVFDSNDNWLNGICTHCDFLYLYKRYCDPNYIIPLKYCWQDVLKLTKYYQKLYKHWRQFKKAVDIMLEPLSIIYYFLHIIFNIIQFFPRLLCHFYKSRKQNQ